MEMKNNHSFLILFLLFLCFELNINHCLGGDTISANESLSLDQTIVSSGGNFELGFFKPGNSLNYYIGIWYKKIYPRTVVWVANREKPVNLDGNMSSPELKIIQGNLVLLDKNQDSIWSSTDDGKDATLNNSVIAVLGDDGNLILIEVSSSTPLTLWQSFDHPTDTFLPGAKLGYNKLTQKKHVLFSWKNSSDPAPGLFSLELDPKRAQFIVKWNQTTQYWASGTWTGDTFSLVPEMRIYYVNNANESYFTYLIFTNSTTTSRLIIDVSGQMKQLTLLSNAVGWNEFWAQPRQQCDVYGYCGAFGVCTSNTNSPCSCLSGFNPRSINEWNSNDYSGGCVRDGNLQCNAIIEEKDSFWMNSTMRLPNQQYTNITVEEASQCRDTCFNSCSCTAYTYDGLGACSIWTGDLFNLRKLGENETERTISVKLGLPQAQTKSKKSMKLKAGLAAIIPFMVLLICSISYIYYRRRRLANGTATDKFSDANKLGQGGFGPVYKGLFPGGIEIAVKRLLSHSGQGIDEFKNEVTLIAKLQHRNLVRLLGCCINATEQILLYEYMPNKSLDTFIFDGSLCQLLDWKKRYDIILGVARGLAYLHHDSRLRIIHRDLKTSNILLDEAMNPKISDFGLARIVEGTRTEANTKKVVGTYGYMSPEYALDGLFSIKSDVFSFGVVILEIISGRKNTGFYKSEEALNLLGYAWRLWIEDKAIQLTEKSLLESYNRSEVIKCINVALLCVQEDSNDRPNMSDIIVMLVGENMRLPRPNRPAFVMRTHTSSTLSSSSKVFNNQVTITIEGGR
ncbi:G-type lectin S-receptor-like serine/threonine-protein kinase At4g03230 isoform X2 [Lycium barbarum]|uniref:G-type lectin S-receptor-like serine/threonine-protein kinase At4g03230 isoform X2 n=1 Tax=Lycium barbarum TaxID=112863 RepID=UPI00293F2E13|nr:G-type lectin S-receptor-like serine/threonine-protein kinase At4g03230 isoform X2 [Lycium barbarum]